MAYLLIKDHSEGSERFERLLKEKVDLFLSHVPSNMSLTANSCLAFASSLYQLSEPFKHELTLLAALMHKQDDSCWESRLRLLLHILLKSLNANKMGASNPIIIECLTLPCLRILNHVCKTSTSISLVSSLANQLSAKGSSKSRPPTLFAPPTNVSSVGATVPLNRFYSEPVEINYLQLQSLLTSSYMINAPCIGDLEPNEFFSSKNYFDKWLQMSRAVPDSKSDLTIKAKCFSAWRKFVLLRRRSSNAWCESKWLRQCLLCTWSRAVRQLTANILQNIFNFYASCSQNNDWAYNSPNAKKFQIAEALGEMLNECGTAGGECLGEFMVLFKGVLNDRECKYRLVLRCGILASIESLLLKEMRHLSDLERASESTASATNLTCGYSIKCLSELLAIFLKEPNIRNKFKGRLIATVLNAYLSLKKLVYQRTKLVDEAQEKLLAVLEQMTSGTEAETRKFMWICVETVNNFDLDDLVTPVYIFERLCNMIYPEEVVDNKEFLMILEKDPNQEDYLQVILKSL